jgi:hypothetical protein
MASNGGSRFCPDLADAKRQKNPTQMKFEKKATKAKKKQEEKKE